MYSIYCAMNSRLPSVYDLSHY